MNHETPSTEVFNEIKQAAIYLWSTYSNEFGYVDEKVSRINSVENYSDNVMMFYRMFDYWNQQKLRKQLSEDAIQYIDLNN